MFWSTLTTVLTQAELCRGVPVGALAVGRTGCGRSFLAATKLVQAELGVRSVGQSHIYRRFFALML